MSDQTKVLLRMCDVALALGAAHTHDQSLNKIRLQKFIYLLDIVGLLYEIFPPRDGHKTYLHGPYDLAIQNAVDALAFRGLVEAIKIKRNSNGTIRSQYQLTDAGKNWLHKLTRADAFAVRWQAALEVGNKVNARGWQRLVELVYAEPTYVGSRPRGYGQRLITSNGLENSAAFLIKTIENGLAQGFEQTSPDRELVVELFFRYLDNYARVQHSQSPSNQDQGDDE